MHPRQRGGDPADRYPLPRPVTLAPSGGDRPGRLIWLCWIYTTILAAALLALRLRHPRPRMVRLALQPGFVACFPIVVGYLYEVSWGLVTFREARRWSGMEVSNVFLASMSAADVGRHRGRLAAAAHGRALEARARLAGPVGTPARSLVDRVESGDPCACHARKNVNGHEYASERSSWNRVWRPFQKGIEWLESIFNLGNREGSSP